MPPLQKWTAADAAQFLYTKYDDFVMKRDILQTVDPPDSQTQAVMWVSFIFASISVIAGLFAFYWFIRMRRGFRQDLIMLLIQSDMAKTMWLIVNPLFYFITNKPFSSNWAFCQVSGFFLTVTIEASDIAVLLIAIHTALFILKRQQPGAGAGLQPYRRVAYLAWIIIPLLIGAIVPLTGNSFVDNGPHCYLPIHPPWVSVALAWSPRYAIFMFIIVTYTGLYIYVHMRYRRFGEDQRRASNMSSQSAGSSTRRWPKLKWRGRGGVPPTPALVTHNLDSPREAGGTSINNTPPLKLRQFSVASTVSTLQISEGGYLPAVPEQAVPRHNSVSWNLVDFSHDGAGSSASSTPYVDVDAASPTADSITLALLSHDIHIRNNTGARMTAAIVTPPEPVRTASGTDISALSPQKNTRPAEWRRRLTDLRARDPSAESGNSLAHIITSLRQGPSPATAEHANEGREGEGAGEAEHSTSSSSIRLSTDVSEEAVRRSRDRMQRQMRLLFVYPAIYLLTWVAPFVTHVYQYYIYHGVSSPSSPSSSSYYAGNDNINNGTTTADAVLMAQSHAATWGLVDTQPLALRIVSIASLCVGAAVDCAFFSAWEQPWRHLRGPFWPCLARRLQIRALCGGGRRVPGRSRDERVADERAARTRRDKEMEMVLRSKRLAAAAAAGAGNGSTAGGSASTAGGRSSAGGGEDNVAGSASQQGRRREWWDALDEAGL
ncbi:G protein-coupled glucose receptor regulating Gpa2-domain-containing protein [Nemania abortiva]|nr:G protein-coupled glucose receptor regulating Gpa2-domain-containing protein [Nemania abortiva]